MWVSENRVRMLHQLNMMKFRSSRMYKQKHLQAVEGVKNIKKKKFSFHDDPDTRQNDSSISLNVCIVFIAHKGVWHSEIWDLWNKGKKIDMYVHKDQEGFEWDSQTSWGTEIPDPIPVERGRLSHAKAIIHSLQFALDNKQYTHYMVLSGDALPVCDINGFYNMLQPNKSIIAFETHDGFITHNMEMILCHTDVNLITTKLKYDIETGKYQNDDKLLEASILNPSSFTKKPPMMDEYVIGSYLYRNNRKTFILNKAIAGWVAIDNSDASLRSDSIDENTILQCSEKEELIAPDSENGEKHIILAKTGLAWKQVSTKTHDKYDADSIIFSQIEDVFDKEDFSKVYKLTEAFTFPNITMTSIVKSKGYYFMPVSNTYSPIRLANSLLFKFQPWDNFIVFRKIKPTFYLFLEQLKNLLSGNPVFLIESGESSSRSRISRRSRRQRQ